MNFKGISKNITFTKKQKYLLGGTGVLLAGLTTAAFLAEEQLEEIFDYVVYNIGDYFDGVPEISSPEEMTPDLIQSPFEVEPDTIDYSPDGDPFTANESKYFEYAQPFIDKYKELVGMTSLIGEKLIQAQIVLENPEFTEDGLRINIDPQKLYEAEYNFQNSGAYMPNNLNPIEEARVLTTLDGVDMGYEEVTTSLKPAPIIKTPDSISLNSIKADNLMILDVTQGDNISDKAVEKIIESINSQTPLNDTQKNRLYVKIINSIVKNNNGLEPHMIHPGEKITICLDSIKDIISGNLDSLSQPVKTIGWTLPK